MATYNAGTDTVTITGTEGSPDTLDSIVSAVANTAKAKKVGLNSYEFDFRILNNATGFLSFGRDSLAILKDCRWDKNAVGGVIFNHRCLVRFEGSGYTDASINAAAGYKVISYRDIAGVNPRLILLSNFGGRYDLLALVNPCALQIQGLDYETYCSNANDFQYWGASSISKINPASGSNISFLRFLSRESLTSGASSERQGFEGYNTTYNNLFFADTGIEMNDGGDASYTMVLESPVFDFGGTSSPMRFSLYGAGTIDIRNPTFPNGAWNGRYLGYGGGFSSSLVFIRISYPLSLTFLSGATAVPMRVRHTRNDATNIDNTANGSGLSSALLLVSMRNGGGVGDLAASATYTWGVKARLYAFKLAGASDSLYTAATFSAATNLTSQCVAVQGLTLSESAAAALTGYSLTASGASAGTLAISGSGTAANGWHFYRQWISTFANFGSSDTWDYDAGLLDIAGWSLSVSGSFTGNVKSLTSTTITGTITTTGSQFGGVITSNKSLTLSGCTFAPGTTINTSAGAISIAVDPAQIANITAGSNVTIFSQSTLTLTGFPNGSRVVISQSGRTQDLVNGQNSPYVFVGPAGGYGVVISAAGFKDLVFSVDLSTSQAIPVSMVSASSSQQVDQALGRFIQFMRADTRYSTMLTEALAVSGLRDEAYTVRLGLWSSAEFKSAWNVLIASSSIADPTSGEVAVWTGYLSQAGYMGISFTSAGGIN